MLKIKKNFKKLTVFSLCLIFIGAITGGCGTKKNTDAAKTSSAPTEISILTDYYTKTAPDASNPVQQKIEKETNSKLNITWVPATNYLDKMNLTLASGQIPDLTFIMNPNDSAVRSLYAQGMFYDLTTLYKDYKSLVAMPEASWANSKAPDGKNYIIPRPRPTEGGGSNFVLRSDLLASAGLSMPKTTDELYNVMKTLKKSNPDFVGFVAGAGSTTTPSVEIDTLLQTFTKANGQWKSVDGKLIFSNLLPEMKDGLAYVSKLYNDKLINEDFAVLKDTKPIQFSGKFIVANLGNISDSWLYQSEIIKSDPKAKLLTAESMNGVAMKASGLYGGYGIYKKLSEDKMKKLMSFMDYMDSPSGGELCSFGIQDIHFKLENGVRKVIQDAADKDVIGGNSYGQIGVLYDKYMRAGSALAGIPADVLDMNKKIVDAREKFSTSAPVDLGISSATGDTLLNEYYKKSADLKTKIILGKEPISSWDTYIQGLKADQTLKKITDELTQSYKSKGGK